MRVPIVACVSLLILTAGLVAGCEDKPKSSIPSGGATAQSPGHGPAHEAAGTPSGGGSASTQAIPADDVAALQKMSAQLPPGHPSIDSSAAPPGKSAGQPKVSLTVPKNWVEEPPSSSFRLAQYRIPQAEGDTQDGQLVVYFFGPGQGGGVEDNLARWRSQFTTADGQPVPDSAVEKSESNEPGRHTSIIEVTGYFTDTMMGGAAAGGGRTSAEYRLFGAIVEAGGNRYFFKASGPKKTIEAARSALLDAVRTAKIGA